MIDKDNQRTTDDIKQSVKNPLLIRNHMITAKIIKHFIKLWLPYTLNGIAINGSFFLNALILSQLGTKYLAATALAGSMQLFTVAPAKVTLGSTSALIARNANNKENIAIILQQSWLQSLIESVPIIAIFLFSKPLLIALGQDKNIATITSRYLTIVTIGIPAILLLKSSEEFAIAMKYPNTILIVNVSNTLITVALTYSLSLGKFGLPKLGIEGAAYANSLSAWICLIGFIIYANLNKHLRQYNILTTKGNNRCQILKKLFAVGLPLGLQISIEYFYNFMKSIIAGTIGQNSLNAEQIVNQYTSIILSPILAASTVNCVLIGRDIATRDSENVKRIGNIGILASIIVPLIGLMLFLLLPQRLTQLFVDKENDDYNDIFNIAKYLFLINGINNLIDGVINATVGALIPFYDTLIPTFIMLGSLWLIGAPCSYLLTYPAKLGIIGFFIGRGISLLTALPFLSYRWYQSSNNPKNKINKNSYCFFCKKSKDKKSQTAKILDDQQNLRFDHSVETTSLIKLDLGKI